MNRTRDRIQFALFYVALLVVCVWAAVWLGGCDDVPRQERGYVYVGHGIYWFHDGARRAACWYFPGHGISCLRDEPDGGAK